jgi:hypothetical protein
LRTSIASSIGAVVLRDFIDPAELRTVVLSNLIDKSSSKEFISLYCNLPKLLSRDPSFLECTMYGGVVYRYEAILLKQPEQFIQKPIRALLDKL